MEELKEKYEELQKRYEKLDAFCNELLDTYHSCIKDLEDEADNIRDGYKSFYKTYIGDLKMQNYVSVHEERLYELEEKEQEYFFLERENKKLKNIVNGYTALLGAITQDVNFELLQCSKDIDEKYYELDTQYCNLLEGNY